MLTIETKKIKISDKLRKKIEMIGKFNNTLYLMFDDCDYVFVNTLYFKIKFKDIENFIKQN